MPAEGLHQLLFRALGSLEAWNEPQQKWESINGANREAFLVALLQHLGEPVPETNLAEIIWGDDPPHSAKTRLNGYARQLRQRMEYPLRDVLVKKPGGYLLAVRPDETDIGLFTQQVRQGKAELAAGEPDHAAGLLREALTLWRGPALAGVSPTPDVAAWASSLEDTRIEAVELRIEADLACRQHGQVIPEMVSLIAEYPLREQLRVLQVQALMQAGRQAEALSAYSGARDMLAQELHAQPGGALQKLHQQILLNDARNAARHTHLNAPASPAPHHDDVWRRWGRYGYQARGPRSVPPQHPPPVQPAASPDPVSAAAEGRSEFPDPRTAETVAEFIRIMAEYRIAAGEPTLRVMDANCGRAYSYSTFCRALKKNKLPKLAVVIAFITACHGSEEDRVRFKTAWIRLRMAEEAQGQPYAADRFRNP